MNTQKMKKHLSKSGVRSRTRSGLQSQRVRRNRFKRIRLVVLVLLLFTLFNTFNYSTTVDTSQQMTSYRIESGDTLWTIAVNHNTANMDPRKIIRDIQDLNGIGNAIYAGEYLQIPVYN